MNLKRAKVTRKLIRIASGNKNFMRGDYKRNLTYNLDSTANRLTVSDKTFLNYKKIKNSNERN